MAKVIHFTTNLAFAVVAMVLVTMTMVKAEMILAFDHHGELLAEVELANRAAMAEEGFVSHDEGE